MQDIFHHIARRTSEILGSAYVFVLAVVIIVGWFFSGPMFNHSDSWQLFINTTTTIVTFLTVILIQNTQNRDAKALHLKLDELIHAEGHARNSLVALENMSESELDALEGEFEAIRERSRKRKSKK